MKPYRHLESLDAPSSQAAHKAIQNRQHSAKTASHRYERRKVRELLRHEDNVPEAVAAASYPDFLES